MILIVESRIKAFFHFLQCGIRFNIEHFMTFINNDKGFKCGKIVGL